jgi:hypothetical protein
VKKAIFLGVYVIVFASLHSLNALASGGDRIPGARYQSVRASALGDAMIGLANDSQDALFYNPSALGKIRDFSLELINLQVQLNKDLVGGFGTSSYKFPFLSQYQSYLNEHPGAQPGGSYSIFPNASFRGFGVGVLYQGRGIATSNGTSLRYRTNNQFIPTAGFGLNLASGVLRFGYGVQWVNQSSGDVTVPSSTSPIGYNYYLKQGAGFAHTIGSTLTLPYIYQPSLQIVVRNIGGVRFSGTPLLVKSSESTGTLDDEDMSIDFGVSWLNKLGGGSGELKTAFVYRDFTNAGETARLAHLSFGSELGFGELFFLRIGYASAYPSAGLGIKGRRGEFGFAWFSEEIGAGLRSERDVRYSLQFKANLF